MNIIVYIDGDNFSFKNYENLINVIKLENKKEEIYIIPKIFGDFCNTSLKNWDKVCSKIGGRIFHIPKIKNKNVTDHFIIVEAMNDLLTTDNEIFILASDDVDFIPLYQAIRSRKKQIWQISQNIEESIITAPFINKKISLANIEKDMVEETTKNQPVPLTLLTPDKKELESIALEYKSDNNQYTDNELINIVDYALTKMNTHNNINLGDLKYWIENNVKGFSMRKTKFRKFSKLIKSLQKYDLELVESDMFIIKK